MNSLQVNGRFTRDVQVRGNVVGFEDQEIMPGETRHAPRVDVRRQCKQRSFQIPIASQLVLELVEGVGIVLGDTAFPQNASFEFLVRVALSRTGRLDRAHFDLIASGRQPGV